MKIVIDMQGAQTDSRYRGIGRYTCSLIQALVRNSSHHDIVLVFNGLFEETLDPVRKVFEGLLPPGKIVFWTAPGPVGTHDPGNKGRQQIAAILREAFIASLSPDVVIISSFFEGYVDNAVTSLRQFDVGTPVCVIAYDFIPLLNPAQYLEPNPGYSTYYRNKVKEFSRADIILAISESSRLEAVDQLGLAPSRATNISAACEPFFKPISMDGANSQALLTKWGLTKPFILYTGGADERKNLPLLIAAFSQLPPETKNSHQLLFAGKLSQSQQSHLLSVAKKHGLAADDLQFTGFLTDDELVMAYNLCQLFVFPSWHEGFGLPPLEAMACGTPTIAGNTSSLPEVIGWSEAMFDPHQQVSITQKMHQSLADPFFRAQLIQHARTQAQKFTWDASACKALEAISAFFAEQGKTQATFSELVSNSVKSSGQLLEELAQTLKKNNMLADTDIDSLAACMAQNEQQIHLHKFQS
jgi:glycosyltransferase involved in cell wall biosynthesis